MPCPCPECDSEHLPTYRLHILDCHYQNLTQRLREIEKERTQLVRALSPVPVEKKELPPLAGGPPC